MMGSSCGKCIPKSEPPSSEDSLSATMGMANILKVPTLNRSQNVFTRVFNYVSFVFSRTTDTNYNDVTKKVLSSQKVKEAIRKQTEEEYKEWIDKVSLQNQINDDGYSSSSSKSIRTPIDKIKYHELITKHRKRAFEIYENMRSCISNSLLRIAGWVLFKLLSRILNTVQIHKGQIDLLKRKANENNIPIIYLPMHRSHLDYILISFILYMNNIRVPLVAAGENLSIPFFGNLMRGLGAFFIKRKHNNNDGKRDYVYRAILQSYMVENLKDGNSIEFFIEGGRSRSGKAYMPKAGLLSVIVSAVLESEINDVYIVPVGISYEKIMDGNFVDEQLGKKKVNENFTLALKAIWTKLYSHFGNMRIDFCEPFSLKDYLRHSKHINTNYKQIKSAESGDIRLSTYKDLTDNDTENSSLINTLTSSCVACASNLDKHYLHTVPSLADFYGLDTMVSDDKRDIIRDLSEHIVYDAFNSSALMSTQLLSFLFLTKYRKGATINQLSEAITWLRHELIRRNRDVGFSGDSIDITRHACNMLNKELITSINVQTPRISNENENENGDSNTQINVTVQYLKPSIKLPNVLELQYYSNNCISIFLLDSIVTNALFSLIETDTESLTGFDYSDISVSKKTLICKSLELCNLLNNDFIFTPPCRNKCDVIIEKIEDFINNGLLIQVEQSSIPYRRQAFGFEVDDFEDEMDDNYFPLDKEISDDKDVKISLSNESIELMHFYRIILSPYIESYWLTACSLIKLINKQKNEKTFFYEIRSMAKEKLNQGFLSYDESIASDTIHNALALFESWNVIDVFVTNSIRNYQLAPKFDNQEAINDLILSIEKFKK